MRLTWLTVPLALLALLLWAPGSHADRPGWEWPVDGQVVTAYDYGGERFAAGQHRGIDIAANAGREVVAASPGTVRFAGPVGSSGLTVAVRTRDGRFDTSYLHLAEALVRRGERVNAGQRIGTVGATGSGSVSTPHLHFGVRMADTRDGYRDPLRFLSPPSAHDPPRGSPIAAEAPVRVGPAPQPVPAFRPVATPPARPAPTFPLGWALACAAPILAAVLLGRSSIGGSCRTTSQPRSTTSTASPTWATSTRRSPPTSSPATCASGATTSSS